MRLAERRGDAKMAKLVVQRIEAAFATLRDGGDAPSAAILEHVPKKLLDFLDQGMLQLFNFELRPYRSNGSI